MAASDNPTVRTCATPQVHERLLRTNPTYAAARSASETRAWEYVFGARAAQRSGVTVIPVVVHVVWNTAAQNISDAQVQSQIAVLNRDYRKLNPDVASTPAVFAPLCGDARVQFELATSNPSGNPTGGIERVKTSKTSFTDDDAVKHASSGGADAWPSDKYLNLWVCHLSGGLLGYAQFPGGPADTDGVVILDTACGDTGTAAAPFGLGRTATHEIGHWLNLRHIWGDDGNGCSGDDFVADTPNCAGANTGMPVFPHVTCSNGPNGDLFMNYMDYTDDAGMFMFTNGQVGRMQACLDGDRPSIGHQQLGPTLAYVDIHPTLTRLDIHPTLAVLDHPTAAISDIHPTLARLDINPTLAVLDNPTLAVTDIHPTIAQLDQPTIAQVDVGPTVAQVDVGPTVAQVDVGPTVAAADFGTLAGSDQPGGNPGNVGDPAIDPTPFTLATPHHTNAWIASHRALRDQQVQSLAAQAQQIEEALESFAEAEARGTLSTTEAATAEQLHGEYQRLMTELGGLGAFG